MEGIVSSCKIELVLYFMMDAFLSNEFNTLDFESNKKKVERY